MSLNTFSKIKKTIFAHHIISISSLDVVLLSTLIAYGLFSIPIQLISFDNKAPSYDTNAHYSLTELENTNELIAEIQMSLQQCINESKTSNLCPISELISKMQSAHKTTDSLIGIMREQNLQFQN